MSGDERRQQCRRSDDDLRRSLDRNQFQTERRHVENTQRFDNIETDVATLNQKIMALDQKIETHLSDERTTKDMIATLHECVDRNAAMIEDQIARLHKVIADMKDNLLPLVLKDGVKKTWWLATLGRQCVQWLTPIVAFLLLMWAIYLYWIGRGPFPLP